MAQGNRVSPSGTPDNTRKHSETSQNQTPSGVQTQRWLTAKQATERLAVSPSTFERKVREQVIPLYRVGPGGPRRFRIEDVDRAMIPEQNPEPTSDIDFITNHLQEG